MLVFSLPLAGQAPDEQRDRAITGRPGTRAGEIEAARRRKAAAVAPETNSTAERVFNALKEKRFLERITGGVAGFRPRLGGLITGSGFALGPEYLERDIGGRQWRFRAGVSASLSLYQKFDVELSNPNLWNDRVYLSLLAVHRNYPRVNYYGPGNASSRQGRSNFRLEDTSLGFSTGLKPFRHFRMGITGDRYTVNVGPGTAPDLGSAEEIYSPAQAPGIDRQTGFLRGGFVTQFDYRDNPGGPRTGGNYIARFQYFQDRNLDLFTFRRADFEAQQYLALFNRRRVIALRGRTVFTYPNPGQRVPFYLQPTLGGADDLRGYRPFRFYDDNMLVLNGEYRWEVFSGLDMALFVDAGKVFHRRSEWNVRDLKESYGFGLRFNVRNDVFMRIDVGFSPEGFGVWLKFNNVF